MSAPPPAGFQLAPPLYSENPWSSSKMFLLHLSIIRNCGGIGRPAGGLLLASLSSLELITLEHPGVQSYEILSASVHL